MGDIAQRVGVSRTAVSFVLNNRDDGSVSPATRERILRAADELGYRPHAGARALAAQRSGLVRAGDRDRDRPVRGWRR